MTRAPLRSPNPQNDEIEVVAPPTTTIKTNPRWSATRTQTSLLRRRRASPIFIDSARDQNCFVSLETSPPAFAPPPKLGLPAASPPPLLSPESAPKGSLVLAATLPESAAKVTASCAYSTIVRADSVSPSPRASPIAASPATGHAFGTKMGLAGLEDLDASPSARRSRVRAAMATPNASADEPDRSDRGTRPLRRSMGLFNLDSMNPGPTPDSTFSPASATGTTGATAGSNLSTASTGTANNGTANGGISPHAGIKRPHPFGPRPDALAKPRYAHSTARAASAPLRPPGGVMCSPTGGRGPHAAPPRSRQGSVQGSVQASAGSGSAGPGSGSTAGDPFDSFLTRCASSPSTSAETWYNGAKPLQTAFMSTGLLSKRNARVQSAAPPETPCKKLPANASLGGASFRGSRSVGTSLFDPHMSLFSSATGSDGLTPRNAHSETSILRASQLGRAPPPVLAGMGVTDNQHTAPSAPTSFLNRTSRKSSMVDMSTPTASGASSLHHSIRSFSLGSNSPGTPTRVEPAFTSTPAPASRMPSDASTVTPSTARARRHGSTILPALAAEAEPSDDEMLDDIDDDDLGGCLAVRLAAKLADPLDPLDDGMTSSEIGSPHTPDASQHTDDEQMHLVGSSSMDSSSDPTSAAGQSRIQQARLARNTLARQLTINVDRSKAVKNAVEALDAIGSSGSVGGSVGGSAGSGDSETSGSIRSLPLRNPKTPVDPSFPMLDANVPPMPQANADVDEALCRRFPRVALLGNGEFSKVFTVGEDESSAESAALAVVKRTKRPLIGALHRARRLEEVEILRDLSSASAKASTVDEGRDYVVHLMDSWEENGYLYIMTEYCENGSLDAFLAESGRSGRLDEWRVWKIMVEMAHGLRYIHSRDFLHLDIKPANIFVTFEGTLKIGDFGMATRFPAAMDIEREGDREYIAPEVLSEGLYTKPADIFSLGIMMVEIAANVVLPDNGIHWHKLRSGDLSDAGRLSSGDLAHGDPDVAAVAPPAWAPYFMIDQSGTLDKIVSSMLNPDPKLRPSAASFLACPEAQLVDDRRGAGAIVWEGDFGPEPFMESVASRLQ